MQKFDVEKWLKKGESVENVTGDKEVQRTANLAAVEYIIQQIEQRKIDITCGYTKWRNIGFALVDEFGEPGRSFYHRLSRFHYEYDYSDCDQKYDYYLKSKGEGIHIGTFFYYAKEAGIYYDFANLADSKVARNNPFPENPEYPEFPETAPDGAYPGFPELPELPYYLKEAIKYADTNEERDALLLGCIVVSSGCLPKIHGYYDGDLYYANLYLLVTGKPGTGKGILRYARQLGSLIDSELRGQSNLFMDNLNQSDQQISHRKMLYIPGNSSSTGVYELLFENNGRALIFETETDTLNQSFKSEHGDFSDGIRKGFHQEDISYYRRGGKELVHISKPCISIVLTGTPGQAVNLLSQAENGLLSRFIHYYMSSNQEFKDVFAQSDNKIQDHFNTLAKQLLTFYKTIKKQSGITFTLTENQQQRFIDFFRTTNNINRTLYGDDFIATTRRFGIIFFRITMTLSALRYIDKDIDLPEHLICEDRDFETTLQMIEVLIKHSSKVLSMLPKKSVNQQLKNKKMRFLERLPATFNRELYLGIARMIGIAAEKTADGYITEFIKNKWITRDGHNAYINLRIKETKDSQEIQEMKD